MSSQSGIRAKTLTLLQLLQFHQNALLDRLGSIFILMHTSTPVPQQCVSMSHQIHRKVVVGRGSTVTGAKINYICVKKKKKKTSTPSSGYTIGKGRWVLSWKTTCFTEVILGQPRLQTLYSPRGKKPKPTRLFLYCIKPTRVPQTWIFVRFMNSVMPLLVYWLFICFLQLNILSTKQKAGTKIQYQIYEKLCIVKFRFDTQLNKQVYL